MSLECVNSSDTYMDTASHIKENIGINYNERQVLRQAMLEYLSTNEKVIFKNSGENQEELNTQQKLDIADELLNRNYGLFLAKFGNYLLKEHLSYFENASDEERVIVNIYLKQINKMLEEQKTSRTIEKVSVHVEFRI